MKRCTCELLASLLVLCALGVAQTTPYYIVNTVAGQGKLAYSGDGKLATSVYLFGPGGMVFDKSGNLYFTDSYYLRLLKISATNVMSTVAGCSGAGCGTGTTGANTQLSDPRGVAIDGAGNLYLGDTNRLLKITADGKLSLVAGTGEYGYSGDGGKATAARIATPYAIAIDGSGNLYFTELENHVIRQVKTDGTIATVAGDGTPGAATDGVPARSSRLNGPRGVAIDGSGNLFVADSNNQRVRRIGTNGIIQTFLGTGVGGYNYDSGQATSVQVFNPDGLAVDASGNLLVSDFGNNRVRSVTPAGEASAIGTDVVTPDGIAVSPSGQVVVGAYIERTIHRLMPDESSVLFAGVLSTTAIGDGGPATSGVLISPASVAVDNTGNLYIADFADQRVRRVDASGVITTYAGTGQFGLDGDGGQALKAQLAQPNGIAADSSGNVYVTNNSRIRRIDKNGVITTVAGNGVLGYSGDNVPAVNAKINFPRGLAVDAAGSLYIADTDNNRVRKVVPGQDITLVAGHGEVGYNGSGIAASTAWLSSPTGVAVDAAGNVYIADRDNHRVRKVSGGIITDVAGTGVAGTSGDGGPATQAQLYLPRSVAVDAAGYLYITTAGRIRRVGPDGTITTIAGGTNFEFIGDGGMATLAGMNAFTLTLDTAGRVYFEDDSGVRIRRLTPMQIFQEWIVNGASYKAGTVAAGEIFSLYGWQIGPASIAQGTYTDRVLAKSVGGTTVTFDGVAAPLIYAMSTVVSGIVPYAVYGKSTTHVEVSYNGQKTNALDIPVVAAMPGIFSLSQTGVGQGAILNWPDYSVNGPSNRVAAGGYVMAYATGEGKTDIGVDGMKVPLYGPYPMPVLSPWTATVGGKPATVTYSGSAPDNVAGVFQVNVQIPSDLTTGIYELVISEGGASSQSGLTVAVK